MTHILALLGIVIISFSAILVVLADVSPSTAALFRNVYALPALLLIHLMLRDRDRRDMRAHLLAFAAGMLLAVDLNLWHRSIGLVGAGLSTVLANIQIVFVGAAAWIMHRERPSRWAFVMVPFVFLGAALISGLGQPGAYGSNPTLGTVYGVLAGLLYAAFLILFRASNRERVHPAGPLLDATAGAAFGALLFGLLDGALAFDFGWNAHLWLVILALLPQVVGWLLIANALPRLPALETSVLLLLQPTLTVLWGVLLFAENLSPLQWSGAAIVIGGVGLLSIKGSVHAASSPDRPPATLARSGALSEEGSQ
jgi:drug/metabolite transporter (DMT)-like permease